MKLNGYQIVNEATSRKKPGFVARIKRNWKQSRRPVKNANRQHPYGDIAAGIDSATNDYAADLIMRQYKSQGWERLY